MMLTIASSLPLLCRAQNPATIDLDTVEVVESHRHRTLKSSAPLFKVDDSDFNRIGITDISDALHRLPGVNLRDYGGLGGLKTVSIRGLGAQHTAVAYDGVVLSDCQSGEVDIARYSLDNVESLSVVIGDNDDIFVPARMAALASSLSINSHSAPAAKGPLELITQLKFGSFGYINPYFRIGKGFTDKFSMNLVGDYTYADNDYPFSLKNGAHTTVERRNNSRMNSGHGEINATWRPTGRSALSGKLYYYDNDRQLPGPAIYYNNENHESLRDRNFFGQLHYRNAFNSQWSLQLHGKFNWASSFYQDIDGKYPGGVLNQNYWQRETYASACLLWLPVEKIAVDYSGDYFFNNFTSNLPNESYPYRHSILQSLTARYRDSRLTATARLLGSIYRNGARIGEGARDFERLSPSASLSLRPFAAEMLYLRLSYKSIFRMPTFNESYFYHYGNPDLRPETNSQINIGATWQVKPQTSWISDAHLSVDAYVNHVKDKIVAIPYNMFVWTVVNLAKARIYGCDLTASSTFSVGRRQEIVFDGNYSYQRAAPRTNPESDEYNKQIAYIPRHSGSVTLGYENPWVNFSVHTTGVSCRYATNENNPATRLGGYMDVGCTAYRTFKFYGHEIELRADVMNLLDRNYVVVARYPMPGRSWRCSVKFTL